MELEASCHCKAVKASFKSHAPRPYLLCYCGICRKLNGGSGAAIDIQGVTSTLQVEGTENLSIYRAKAELTPGKLESVAGWRYFCRMCGTHLWLWIPDRPGTIHVFASAVDTPLPQPDQFCHIFAKDRLPWVRAPSTDGGDEIHDGLNPVSQIEWHKARGWFVD